MIQMAEAMSGSRRSIFPSSFFDTPTLKAVSRNREHPFTIVGKAADGNSHLCRLTFGQMLILLPLNMPWLTSLQTVMVSLYRGKCSLYNAVTDIWPTSAFGAKMKFYQGRLWYPHNFYTHIA